MHQLPLFLSFFLVPAFLPAQTNDGELHDMDVQVEESSVDPATAIKQSIPARLKTGKPELFAYQGRYGYVLNDSILIQPEYTALEKPYSDFMIARDSRNYFGVLNKKGEAVLPFEYYDLSRTAANLVLAGQKGLGYGLLDEQGKVLLPMEYRHGHKFADSTVVFHSPGKQKIIKIQGANDIQVILEAGFEDISKSQTGTRPLFTFQEKGLWGLMDYNKRTILPAAYDKIHAVYDSQIMAEKDGKSGVVSFQGKTLIPLIYDRIAERFRNGNYRTGKAIAPLKWLYGMVDTAGRTLLEQEYESVEQCYHSDFFRVGRQGKKGLVGATGQLQIPIQYGEIYELKHPDWTEQPGQPRYVNREAYGLYFKTRNTQNDLLGLWQLGKGEVLKPEYQGIDILLVGGPYSVQQNDKKALFSGAGQQLTGFDYTWLGYGPMRPEVISAGLPEQKMTLLRLSDGKPVEPEVYDEILPIRDTDTGYMVSKNGGKWALHAPNGKRLTLHQYTWIRRWDKEQQIDGLPPGRVLIAQSAVYADKGPQFFALDDAGGEYPTDGWGR